MTTGISGPPSTGFGAPGTGNSTDDQVLTINGDQLTIEDGNTVDLSQLEEGPFTDMWGNPIET